MKSFALRGARKPNACLKEVVPCWEDCRKWVDFGLSLRSASMLVRNDYQLCRCQRIARSWLTNPFVRAGASIQGERSLVVITHDRKRVGWATSVYVRVVYDGRRNIKK